MKLKIITLFLIFSTFLNNENGTTVNNERIGTWYIRKGVLIKNHSKASNLAAEHWEVFYNIFPKKITRKYIKKLVLISDGIDEKTGALGALNKNNTKWQLVIDTLDVNFKSKNRQRLNESVYTLIHEFGHLLTLNNTQIRPTLKLAKEKKTDPYITVEGEAFKGSYINKFVKEFWKGDLLNEWNTIQNKYCFTEENCVRKLYGLYQDNFTDFLTDYAAESPEEDIVESWTAFVLRDKISKPKTIAQKKINFFYQFPELVSYRALIRKNTRKYLK